MNRFKFYLLMTVLLLPLAFFALPSHAAKEQNDIVDVNKDGVYHIEIQAQQWEYGVIDLESDPGKTNPMMHSIHFPKAAGQTLIISLTSKDVQHGFSVNEWNLAIALNRPKPGEEFSTPIVTDPINLPVEDVTYSAFCHIFCGLGHPDMKLKIVIGDGSPNIGLWVFWGAIALNAAIFGLTIRSVLTKVQLMS